ncbi:hypothetical protein [Schinkia azotoformans]|uniref:hypothetical protein n=1 Tax=Schinkia azotoformans TaxID=1454 RepID=UPI002DBBE942|nr:hypothetical protein [Schinkia azotoformans]MEC1715923.1 hypothetical protein [Schinkia azotoformans]MEC1741562.1 hypothetical protein [Schinkia azotoformans]MEC1744556.1 hypothetical protein [Schinkia azotoformans]MEC1758453.1 hypothetical protein [Schinkia azotoformans]MEC1765255.1 hypothetical protein [Schinkia azotoformans]
MSDTTFTQEQLDEQIAQAKGQWETEFLNPIKTELEEMKGKLPKDLTDEEKAIQTKQQELFVKECNLSLKEAGLEKFANVVKVSNEDELKETIKSLTTIVNELKVEMGYVPDNHKNTDAYSQAEQKKDIGGMLSVKLANLFK